MGKVTVEDLNRIKEKTRSRMAMREQKATARITVHMGDCGIKAGGREVMKVLLEEIGKSGRDDIRVFAGDCLGVCETEPNVTVEIEGRQPVVYQKMDQDKVRRIFDRHVLGGDVQKEDTVEVPAGEAEPQTNQEG
ncbi:MAG: (2Fe-2S) ferredoxin domain-containing protein [Desulfobacteraceae bacterium]|nr:(2Fe-2S) ferredoxin domain-containing protein [Desulfobacteraceae bacterium]MCF8095808.1 (2Fe-2S) ferredoxin domain-containing protein [Desulfobacteraceae bacterium]